MCQPGHTDTASPHQRECIDLDGAATASARRVRAERKLERPVQAVCSTELSTRSCLASEPTAQGTGAVARVSSEGRGFHGGADRRVCVERKLETPAQAGALKCLPPVCLIGGPETQTNRRDPLKLSQTESRRWQRQHVRCDETWKGAGEGAAATEAVDCCCCTMRYRKFSTIFSNPTQRCEAQSEEV